jgi:hypothetical protein
MEESMTSKLRRGARVLRCLAWALVFWTASSASVATAKDIQCWVNCAVGSKDCALSAPGTVVADAKLSLSDRRSVLVSRCDERRVVQGEVIVRYLHARRLFVSPQPLVLNKPLAELFAQNKPDDCSVPSSECLQKSMQGLKAAAGGHGVDSQASAPAGQGEPCSLGLPCGTVMPPPAAWQFALRDAAFDGLWRTRVLRGQPAPGAPSQAEGAVTGGVVAADGSQLAPGVTYAYVLQARDGSTRASGEFTVQSAAQNAALRRLVERRMQAGLPEEVAWLDALAANQLDWDAVQRVKP